MAVLAIQIATHPPAGLPDFGLVVSAVAMTVVAACCGWIVGSLAPIPVAVPVSILAVAQWSQYPLTDGANVSWRHMTGYAMYLCCDAIEQAPDWRAILASVPLAAVLFLLAALTIRMQWRHLALPAAAAVTIALLSANVLTTGTNATASVLRDLGSQVCEGDNPAVCTYPETPATTRAFVAAVLSSGYDIADEVGIDLPSSVSAPAQQEAGSSFARLAVHFPVEPTYRQILTTFTSELYAQTTCNPIVLDSSIQLPDYVVIPYALATTMGADPSEVLPNVAFGSETSVEMAPVSPAEVEAALGLPTQEDRLKLVLDWQLAQSDCEG
ncbi:hypothetical protein [uncultured Schumannella sp.]|uniref:hypothetical protein n=1 Tax=uncultured Schumannella sp. TaxID=1195956 RepID=UPI0025FD55FC|nr:hypothetical protein [uncultured Schumannella sp.]